MAAPSSGTEVPCSPQSEESPEGDRPSPAGTTELAAAEASAGVAFATIASLAPLERGGRSGVENSRIRCLTCNSYCSAVKHPCRRRSPSSRSPWASPAGAGPSELNAALISKARHPGRRDVAFMLMMDGSLLVNFAQSYLVWTLVVVRCYTVL